MRRKESVHAAVFRVLQPFNEPDPKNPPTSWSNLVHTRLVPELQQEVANFYGDPNCLEARFAGLDYAYPPHQRRLSRFPYHNRLFRAFDWLALSPNEIRDLCNWERTLHAKTKYEKTHNVKIRDTTGDAVPLPPPGSPAFLAGEDDDFCDDDMEDDGEEEEEYIDAQQYNLSEHNHEHAAYAHAETQASSPYPPELHTPAQLQGNASHPPSLNQALNASLFDAAVSFSGSRADNFSFDPEMEQWWKDSSESSQWGPLLDTMPPQIGDDWQHF